MQAPILIQIPYRQDCSEYFQRVRHLNQPAWLDSCAHQSGMANSRYDIISAAPECTIKVIQGTTYKVADHNEPQALQGSAFDALQTELQRYQELSTDLPFCGGALGYFGYELKSQLEPKHCSSSHRNVEADMMAGIYLWAVINDHQLQQCQLVFHPEISTQTQKAITQLFQPKQKATHEAPETSAFTLSCAFSCDTSKASYQQSFAQIQNYIQAGDCYQINFTQRFTSQYSGDPFIAYQNLRQVSPAPFSAFLEFDKTRVLSHSPERFLYCSDRHIESKPIKGTRRRGNSPDEDKELVNQLLNSQKDRAENLMIVDLLRNDLGRSCAAGSVQVPKLFALESYANVHHLVSTVEGKLAPDASLLDLFSNAFPGGSITGAPKIRAMEIIDELEEKSRSIYCGSIAYISLNGKLDSNICIRTLLTQQENIHCWGGGGIVADSDCEAEREESFTKIRNLIHALETTLSQQQSVPDDRDL